MFVFYQSVSGFYFVKLFLAVHFYCFVVCILYLVISCFTNFILIFLFVHIRYSILFITAVLTILGLLVIRNKMFGNYVSSTQKQKLFEKRYELKALLYRNFFNIFCPNFKRPHPMIVFL